MSGQCPTCGARTGFGQMVPLVAQPAQAVDVGAIREVIAECQRVPIGGVQAGALEAFIVQLPGKLTRALSGEKAGPVDGWHPIETAPKNGTEVLLRVELRAGFPGRCLVGHYMRGGHCIEDHPPIDAGWYFWNGCMFDMASKPLEWMPLPASPTPGKEGA